MQAEVAHDGPAAHRTPTGVDVTDCDAGPKLLIVKDSVTGARPNCAPTL